MSMKPVSRELAQQVRGIVIAHFETYTHNADGSLVDEKWLPVLREPDSGWGDHWVLAWEEGGPYEWTALATSGGIAEFSAKAFEPAEFPRTVFCEPVNGIELGVYPPG
jgi:hypothetical protein